MATVMTRPPEPRLKPSPAAAPDLEMLGTRTAVSIGRVLLSAIFLMSGVSKLTDWSGTAAMMEAKGLPMVPVLLGLAAAVELSGGLSVLLGCCGRFGAGMLFAFLIPTTLVFHNFWAYEGPERTMQMIHFMKNLAIMGGLLLMVGLGSGPCSIDWWRARRAR